MTKFHSEWLPGACGISCLYGFNSAYANPLKKLPHDAIGGSGWTSCGFINNEENKEAYNELKSNYNIAFQTEARTNSNSGNEFIFVVYDVKTTYDAKINKEYTFPWDGKGKAVDGGDADYEEDEYDDSPW